MSCKVLEQDKRIRLYGRHNQTDHGIEVLKDNLHLFKDLRQPEARLVIQDLIDVFNIRADVLFEGNGVYSFKKITNDIRKLKKQGMKAMTHELYEFLHLCCGSIAHYNKGGWIEQYPTIAHFQRFFRCNEFGQRVLDYIPAWKTDVIKIVKSIERILRRV